MAHHITKTDRQDGTTQAWHKLTNIVEGLTLRNSWLNQWDIVKSPLHVIDASGKAIKTEYCQLIATDNPAIHVGSPVHCDTYQPITNAKFIEIIESALSDIKGAKIESVGSVCNRGKVFVSVKLQDLEIFRAAGRSFIPYLNFINSHDQSSPFGVMTSNVCTVCANTFGMNLRLLSGVRSGLNAAKANSNGSTVRIRLKHSKNVADRLENIPEIIDGFLGAQAEFQAALDGFALRKLPTIKALPLFAGFLSTDADVKGKEEISTRKDNQINRLRDLFISGNGNKGESVADAFSAITDYYSHESSGGDDAARQFVSSEFGSGQSHKARAFSLFQSDESVANLISMGEAVLSY